MAQPYLVFFIGRVRARYAAHFRHNVRRKAYSIRMAITSTFLYVIVNAFTDSAFGGNPAAVVFLPPDGLTADSMLLAAPTKISIAQCFVQLTTVFLSSSIHTEVPDSDENRVFDILFIILLYFVAMTLSRLPRPYIGGCSLEFRKTWQGTLS